MAKIRVALCITDLDIGGAERCLTEIAVRVDRSRFEPVVYCLGPRPLRAEASCVPALEAAGIEVHCLGGRGIWQFPIVAHRLKRLLGGPKAANSPDVPVSCQYPRPNCRASGGREGRCLGHSRGRTVPPDGICGSIG